MHTVILIVNLQVVDPPEMTGAGSGIRSIVQEVEFIKEEFRIVYKEYKGDYLKYACKQEELNNRMKV